MIFKFLKKFVCRSSLFFSHKIKNDDPSKTMRLSKSSFINV